MEPRKRKKVPLWVRIVNFVIKAIFICAISAVSAYFTVSMLKTVLLGTGSASVSNQASSVNGAIMDQYDMQLNNAVSTALDGILSIEKVYWLRDDVQVAPEPNQACYGTAEDPSELGWLLEAAQEILGGQELYFSTETALHKKTGITYYLDETIFAITWKESYEGAVYTLSEVKIAHPSQLRRFLAGGEFGSEKTYVTTEMAASVNAVVASSGDFYNFRRVGIVTYDGVVQRVNAKKYDSCMITQTGDLLLVPHGEITTVEAAQAYVDANDVRFSLAFGPILIKDGVRCEPDYYPLGEIEDGYARAAICQMDELHYILLAANGENGGFWNLPNIHTLASFVEQLGAVQAYTLDGGQTAVIVMNDEMKNNVQFGSQRRISDIIYFATAMPDGE